MKNGFKILWEDVDCRHFTVKNVFLWSKKKNSIGCIFSLQCIINIYLSSFFPFIQYNDELHYYAIPVFLACAFAFMVASSYFSVYEVCISSSNSHNMSQPIVPVKTAFAWQNTFMLEQVQPKSLEGIPCTFLNKTFWGLSLRVHFTSFVVFKSSMNIF